MTRITKEILGGFSGKAGTILSANGADKTLSEAGFNIAWNLMII